jgi:hypothetical protein
MAGKLARGGRKVHCTIGWSRYDSSMLRASLLCLACATAIASAQPVRSDTIVRTIGAPLHPGIPTLVPEITIGGPDATSAEYTFDQINGILVARDGSLWITDGQRMGKRLFRQYDSTGKFVRHIGHSGQGPGEWQGPDGLAQLPDGRILLRDSYVPNPITIYRGTDGAYDSTLTFRQTVGSLRVDTTGVLWLQMFIGGGMVMSAGGPLAYVRMRANGRIIDTIPAPTMPPLEPRKYLQAKRPDGSTTNYASAPFQPSSYYAWSPAGYFAGVTTTRYAVDLLKPPLNRARGRGGAPALWRDGDPVLSIRRTAAPVVLSEDERHDRREYMLAQVRASGGTPTGSIREIPRTKPPITRVKFDDDARMWVGVAAPSERFTPPPPTPPRAGQRAPAAPLAWREPILYDVYQPDGRYAGQVRLPYSADMRPYNTDLWVARGDRIWIVERDDDGVESVHRYRIQWAK